MKKQPEPKPIPAGDRRVLLGMFSRPPRIDCRVIAEPLYQAMIKALKKSGHYDQIFSHKKLPESQELDTGV